MMVENLHLHFERCWAILFVHTSLTYHHYLWMKGQYGKLSHLYTVILGNIPRM